jgi:hypothetical protein
VGQVSAKFRSWAHEGRRGLNYWCQGCGTVHGVVVEGAGAWGWNGLLDRPTFTPSVLSTGTRPLTEHEVAAIRAGESITPEKQVCHTFITDGRVQFLSDCSHALAGQTHDLPDLPDWLKDET